MASTLPKKPRSGPASSRSATPASSKLESTSENRKARRKRARESKEEENGASHVPDTENAEAGPSKPPVPNPTGFGDEDFIAFVPSEPEDDVPQEDAVNKVVAGVVTDEKGKGKAREYDRAGRKRKSDEIDLDDGYANKKERMDAKSRRAPWAVDVDWENCPNVAEMYVFNYHVRCSMVYSDAHSQVASRSRCVCEVHVAVPHRR